MGKKVLVANSDVTVQQVTSYFLNLDGFDVKTVGDGVSAMEEIERFSPDIVLLDPELKGINGIEIFNLMQEKEEYQNIPVVFIAPEDCTSIPEGYDIIPKPIDPTKMMKIINRNLAPPEVLTETGESPKLEEMLGWEVPGPSEEGIKTESLQQTPGSSVNGDEDIMERAYEPAGYTREDIQVESAIQGYINEDMVKEIVNRLAGEIVERVAREIVPEVAEREVKKEIERLKGGEDEGDQ